MTTTADLGSVIDDGTRECLALVADTSLSEQRAARELGAVIGQRGQEHVDAAWPVQHAPNLCR